MNEYDLYKRILAPHLSPEDQTCLAENKNTHKAKIIAGKIAYTLYRYDQDEQKELFLPFFNHSHGLKDLLKFCDYILLAERNNKLYVLLIEMKNGSNTDAQKQLEASETFMNFIQDTASRICSTNGYDDFNQKNITTRRIILKPQKSKSLTNLTKSKGGIDWTAQPLICTSDVLPLHQICIPN